MTGVEGLCSNSQMPPQKIPHPRSLAALFGSKIAPRPRPVRKPARKVCSNGHTQATRWKAGDFCIRCDIHARQLAAAVASDEEQAQWRAEALAVPAVLTIKVRDTGKVIRFAIPKGAKPRGRAMGRKGRLM